MNIQLNQNKRNYRQYSIIILAVWLFALFIHSNHNEIVSQSEQLTECHLCQNVLDRPSTDYSPFAFAQRMTFAKVIAAPQASKAAVQLILPPLRAPPLI